MNQDSKIYLAGHAGLVGSAILRRLSQDGYKNIITASFSELDLRRQDQVEKFFEQHKPEYVFLAAAKVGGILANNTYKADFIYDNLMIATNIIHASYKFGVKKLLNLGSSCIYPKLAPQPIKEEYLLSDYLEATNEPYAIAKIAAIKLCRYYNEQYGTNFISVMPTNLYGPGDNFNLETAHVLPSILRKFHLAKLLEQENFGAIEKDKARFFLGYGLDKEIAFGNSRSNGSISRLSSGLPRTAGFQNNTRSSRPPAEAGSPSSRLRRPARRLGVNSQSEFVSRDTGTEILEKIGVTKNSVTLWGSGQPYREFLYVDDLADCLMFLMQNYDYENIGEIINIGVGVDIHIKDLAQMIKEIVGFKGKIKFDSEKPDGTPRKLLDVSRINKLGWKSKIDLQDGLKKFYEWYKK